MNFEFNCVNRMIARRWVVAVMMVVVAGGCDSKQETPIAVPSTPAGANGGELIVALPQDVRSLYPPAIAYALDFQVANSVYDRLADIGDDLNTQGDSGFDGQLAEGWKWAPDSLSIAFRLKANAKFHDGVPVRSEDVKFSFRAYSDSAGGSQFKSYFSNIDSVSTPDSLTATMWFKRRTPQQFFDATYFMYIMPAHLYAKIPIGVLGKDSVTKSPVGSGRFRFVGHVDGQYTEIISDTGNYRGRAKLNRVLFKVYAGFPAATLATLNADADFFEKLQPEDLDQAQRKPNLKLVPYVQAGYTFLSFNLRMPLDHTKPHPIFSDIRVRRALTMAVDRVASARSVLDTFATVSFGPAPRMMFPKPEALKQLPFDTLHARALLDTAGWLLPAGKNVRVKDGVPLSFEIILPATSKPRINYAALLEQQFRGIGASVHVRLADGTMMNEIVVRGKFDTYLGGWTVTPGMKGIPPAWGTSGLKGQNFGAYSNKKFDDDVDMALNTLKPAEAAARWQSAFQQIIDDAPAIFLYEERQIGVMHSRILQQHMRADGWYAKLADWSIDPAKRLGRDK